MRRYQNRAYDAPEAILFKFGSLKKRRGDFAQPKIAILKSFSTPTDRDQIARSLG